MRCIVLPNEHMQQQFATMQAECVPLLKLYRLGFRCALDIEIH